MRRPRWLARLRLRRAVLYVCIPAHNEAATIGVLLWRLRTVLGAAGREYEVVVHDDGSTDATAEVVEPYGRVLPLTRIGGAPSRGRSAAVDALVRHVVAHSRYPRRDACVFLQADFTDRPEDVPALLTAFDAGADIVAGQRAPEAAQPPAERRLRRMGPWVLRPLVRVDGVDDLLTSLRLFRVAVLRDLVRAAGAAPLVDAASWAGVAELLIATVPFARRVDVVDTPGRHDVRPRASRLDWALELRGLARYAWRARGTHARPDASRPTRPDAARPTSPATAGETGAAPAPGAPADATPRTRAERPRQAERRSRAADGPSTEAAPPRPRSGTDANGPERATSVGGAGEERPATRRSRRRAAERAAERDAAARGTRPDSPTDAVPGAPAHVAPADASVDASEVPARARGARAGSRSMAVADEPTPSHPASLADAEETTDGVPARRKKRRRRRTRDGARPELGIDDLDGDAPAGGTSGSLGPDAEVTNAPRPGDETSDERGAEEGGPDEAASPDSSPTARRRKRRRSRSGKRTSGVPPAEGVTDARPANDSVPTRSDESASSPPLDRSSLSA